MMKAYVTTNVLGVFALDEENKLLARELFHRSPGEIMQKLRKAERALIKEEERVISKLGGYEVWVEKPGSVKGVRVLNPNPAGMHVRGNLGVLLEELGCPLEEYRSLLRAVCLVKAEADLRAASAREDKQVIQAVGCLADVEEALNILMERAREWHALSMPRFEEAAAKGGELLAKIALSDDAALRGFGGVLAGLQKYREELEDHIGRLMEKMAPNLTALAGPILGARLIALAKGLDNLARMPGSRIQILGARRAFLRAKRKKLPPKHGVIFQHPLVRGAPWWQRGKVARSLASKIAIAARVDAYSGGYVGEELRRELEKRVQGIRRQYPREPGRRRRRLG